MARKKIQEEASHPSPEKKRGSLLIFSAPSGSGKSTIIQWLMNEHPELKLAFSISATSRPPRGTEQNGVEYFFLSPDEFRQKIQNEQVERQLEAGQNVVFDVDVKGGCNIKEFYGNQAMSLFIQPPSIEELRRRLINRGTDDMEQIEKRVAKAEYELSFAPRFDHIVVNDILEDAEAEALRLINEFLEK